MAKNKKAKIAEVETTETTEVVEVATKDTKEEKVKKDKKKDSKKAKKNSNKKGLSQKSKELYSELKKVTWPSFGKVFKTTCVVLLVVTVCTLILFGADRLFSLIFTLLMGK